MSSFLVPARLRAAWARPAGTGLHFYGWRVVLLSALVMGMTGPGQTVGVAVFVDPMMASLDITRSQMSLAYLVGTLAGAGTMPWFERMIDRRGVRFGMTTIAVGFTVVLAAMAGVGGLVTLTLGFVGIRMLGQGALTMCSPRASSAPRCRSTRSRCSADRG